VGLLDFFRRKGPDEPTERAERATTPSDPLTPTTEAPEPGLPAEGPPVGEADPGSVTGEDVAGHDADRLDR
jgi:hypothetical protein